MATDPSTHVYAGGKVGGEKAAKDQLDVVKELKVEVDKARDLMLVDENSNNVVSIPVAVSRLPSSHNNFVMKIGPPKVQPGHPYSVRVNGAGPGNLSDTKILRFKIGPPNKPKRPTALLVSPTEVAITACRLSERDENGGLVTKCIVEYVPREDVFKSTWNTCTYNMLGGPGKIRMTVGSLNPDTRYYFRVKMKNCAGESEPSDYIVVVTNQVPQDVRLSRKRTSTTLKLRWKEPTISSNPVCVYNVQICRAKKVQKWENYRVEKLSFKFVGLRTDTWYLFRVQSVNNKGEVSDWSDEIEGLTRIHKAACATAAIAVGIVYTVFAPIVALFLPCACGVVAAMVAGDNKEEEDREAAQFCGCMCGCVGGAAAGLLLGTVGAPVLGAGMGYLTYKDLTESEDSPQTSDDEDTEFCCH